MADKPWKRFERETAKAAGTTRNLRTGRDEPDWLTDAVVAECKYRKTLPKWFKDAVEQARRYAKKLAAGGLGDRLPVVLIKERGMHGHYIVLHSLDAPEWFGDLFNHDEEEER